MSSIISRKNIKVMTVLNIGSAVLGILYSYLQAKYYGVGNGIEEFFAANMLFTSLLNLSQSGQAAEITLPIYLNIKKEQGVSEAQQFYSVLINWFILILLFICLLIMCFAHVLIPLFVPGFDQNSQALVAKFLMVLIPFGGISILAYLFQTYLNAEKKFGQPETLTMISSFLSIIILLVLSKSYGIWALVYGQIIGQLFLCCSYIILMKRLKFQYHFVLNSKYYKISSVAKQMIHTYTYTAATQIYGLVLTASLSILPAGNLAIYNYVRKLFDRVSSVLLRPVSIVAFTQFSEQISQNITALKSTINDAHNLNFKISILCFSLAIVAGFPALIFLWHNEKFDLESVQFAYQLLIFLFLLLFFQGYYAINRKLAISLGLVKKAYLAFALVQLVSAVAAFLSLRYFGQNGLFIILAINILGFALASFLVLRNTSVLSKYYPVIVNSLKWIISCMFAVLIIVWINNFSLLKIFLAESNLYFLLQAGINSTLFISLIYLMKKIIKF